MWHGTFGHKWQYNSARMDGRKHGCHAVCDPTSSAVSVRFQMFFCSITTTRFIFASSYFGQRQFQVEYTLWPMIIFVFFCFDLQIRLGVFLSKKEKEKKKEIEELGKNWLIQPRADSGQSDSRAFVAIALRFVDCMTKGNVRKVLQSQVVNWACVKSAFNFDGSVLGGISEEIPSGALNRSQLDEICRSCNSKWLSLKFVNCVINKPREWLFALERWLQRYWITRRTSRIRELPERVLMTWSDL